MQSTDSRSGGTLAVVDTWEIYNVLETFLLVGNQDVNVLCETVKQKDTNWSFQVEKQMTGEVFVGARQYDTQQEPHAHFQWFAPQINLFTCFIQGIRTRRMGKMAK